MSPLMVLATVANYLNKKQTNKFARFEICHISVLMPLFKENKCERVKKLDGTSVPTSCNIT